MEIGIATDNTIPLYIPRFIEFVRAHSNVISCQQIKTQRQIPTPRFNPKRRYTD